MKINNKEVGFWYSIGADSDIDDEMKKIGVNDFAGMIDTLGSVTAYAKLGAIMSKWYCKKNGGEPLTEDDFYILPAGALNELEGAIIKALNEGRETEIKTKSKNAKGAAKK